MSGNAGRSRGLSGRDELDWQGAMRESYLTFPAIPLAYAIIEQSTTFVLRDGRQRYAEKLPSRGR
ncbi:MAG TPA: hypothetical protein VNM48_09380 [Chloroflexota bacterium]|nr:hypothetical protein [Chloroflexota bacterium]